jgi:mono/diheme cytochrome c family protein
MTNSRRMILPPLAILWGLGLTVFALSPALRTDRRADQRSLQDKWNIPEAAKTMKNPLPATASSLARGKELFQANCVMCHGEKGDGTGEMAKRLETTPSDLTDANRMDTQTDGELFYKISTGTDEMPEYGAILEKEEIWHLVNYVRSLVKKNPRE